MPQIVVRGPGGPPITYDFDQDLVTIGRSSASDLVIGDVAVSRQHVELRLVKDSWTVRDCGSMNGTRLNSQPLVPSATLVRGDEITIGETVVVFDSVVQGSVPEAQVAPDTVPLADSSRGAGRTQSPRPDSSPSLIGSSKAMAEVRSLIERVAPTNATVLVTGESGTGKELVARAIHLASDRAAGPFVVVNCPALPGNLFESELFGIEKGVATGVEPRKGRLENGNGGTVFLDEVADLEAAAQAKLLRVLQEKTFERVGGRRTLPLDVRFVAATNHDLQADIASGKFRLDLFHRLNHFPITLPPLRDRRGDLPLLVDRFLAQATRRVGISDAALESLARYDFPGNVRELEYLIERAALVADREILQPEDLPVEVREEPSRARPDERLEERLYERIRRGDASFWDAVQQPYLRRSLSHESVRRLVERAYNEAGMSYKEMTRQLHLDAADYRKLVNFLNHHDLTVRR